jgi:two-component system nitrogen regulation response regulator GlnG
MSAVSLMALPGNVRQLENLCHWITVMAPSQLVRAEDLPEEVRQSEEGSGDGRAEDAEPALAARVANAESAVKGEIGMPAWQELLRQEVARALAANAPAPQDGRMHGWAKEFEAAVLGVALKHTRGRRIEAAQLLGIGRNTMTRKIAELNLEGGD